MENALKFEKDRFCVKLQTCFNNDDTEIHQFFNSDREFLKNKIEQHLKSTQSLGTIGSYYGTS